MTSDTAPRFVPSPAGAHAARVRYIAGSRSISHEAAEAVVARAYADSTIRVGVLQSDIDKGGPTLTGSPLAIALRREFPDAELVLATSHVADVHFRDRTVSYWHDGQSVFPAAGYSGAAEPYELGLTAFDVTRYPAGNPRIAQWREISGEEGGGAQ